MSESADASPPVNGAADEFGDIYNAKDMSDEV